VKTGGTPEGLRPYKLLQRTLRLRLRTTALGSKAGVARLFSDGPNLIKILDCGPQKFF